MTKGLPATLADAEMAAVKAAAVAYARRHVRRLKNDGEEKISAQPLELRDGEDGDPWSWFGLENGRAWAKARLKALAVIPERAPFVCELARDGDAIADEVIREVLVAHRERREEPSPSLVAYESMLLLAGLGRPRPRRRRDGWYKPDLILRNLAVAQVVAEVCRAFGLPPTRNQLSRRRHLSGCYIAWLALQEERVLITISESGVVEAWRRYNDLLAVDA
jgi:hypothetical protein